MRKCESNSVKKWYLMRVFYSLLCLYKWKFYKRAVTEFIYFFVMTMIPIKSRKRTKNNVLKHVKNQAFLRHSLEVISNWRLLTFCSVLLLRNTVLMFQKNLQTWFDVACSRRSDRTRKTTNVTTYKQNEPSIILLVDSKRLD